jgi:hypothetical protein
LTLQLLGHTLTGTVGHDPWGCDAPNYIQRGHRKLKFCVNEWDLTPLLCVPLQGYPVCRCMDTLCASAWIPFVPLHISAWIPCVPLHGYPLYLCIYIMQHHTTFKRFIYVTFIYKWIIVFFDSIKDGICTPSCASCSMNFSIEFSGQNRIDSVLISWLLVHINNSLNIFSETIPPKFWIPVFSKQEVKKYAKA